MSKLVVLLCGIPGSGKSTIAHELLQHLNLLCANIATLVSYDAFERQYEWNADSFHFIRHAALKEVERLLVEENDVDNLQIEASWIPFRKIILVDDIMYLRSMRRQVYNMVRDQLACCLLTIHVTCDLELARTRNQSRQGIARVTDKSFENVLQNFQAPNITHICDRNLLVIDSDNRNIEDAIKSICEAITHSKHYCEQCKQAHDEKSKGNPDNNSISLVKRVDETLRKIISKLVPVLKCDLFSSPKPKVGLILSNLKASFLKKARGLLLNDLEDCEESIQCLVYDFILDARLLLLSSVLDERKSDFELTIKTVIL